MSTSPAPVPARRETIAGTGGVNLSCIVRNRDGDATPLLLVHGLASNARLWDGVADRLAASGHPVVAVDQRGHGRSEKPGDGYDFQTLTADLLALVDHYGWDRPLAAGQSWGANVVLELAALHPDAVSAVALIDGGTHDLADGFADWPTCEAALAPPPLDGMPAARVESHIRNSHPGWPEQGVEGTLANMEFLPDGTIRPWLSREDHMVILRHLWEHKPSTRFAEMSVPVLIIPARDESNQRWMQGKRDSVERAAKLLPRSVVHWIDGDHDLHAQHPDVVADLLDAATQPGFFS
ncbi:MAG TPA: alpha/beta hydrolase [Acidimicrobiales bacterium]|nr:alpha/beta hydrolase [Acidimicrobiales bacterium]